MKSENNKCLVLNSDYTPLSIIDWKRALLWSIKHQYSKNSGVIVIDFYKDDYINCANGSKLPIPAVVRTIRYFKLYSTNINFSRKNVFVRDDYTCQYCGQQPDLKHLTYDHVIPKSKWDYSKGTPTTWYNVVTSCVSCNRKKGNKVPKEANMILRTFPEKPTNKNGKFLPFADKLIRMNCRVPEEWLIYIPQSYQNNA
jgi:5-methylcytosine-specific restriction endonuclease McrA